MYAVSRLDHNWLIKQAINDKVFDRLQTFSDTILDLDSGVRPFEPYSLRLTLTLSWWVNQQLERFLDRWWREERETAGYFVTARKP